MAEEESSHGLDVSGFLWRKTGPLPNAVWIFTVAAIGFYLYKRRSVSTTGGASTATADPGQFSTSSTTTDPNTGSQTTFTANGPNSSILSPGFLSTQAQPMGYSGGDVFVNYPGGTTAPQPKYPPVNAPPPQPGQTGSFWYTLPKDMRPAEVIDEVYRIGNVPNTPQNNAYKSNDLVAMLAQNPQINWQNVGGALKAGTAVYIPLQSAGSPTDVIPLPAGASQLAPATYQPPPQQTSMQSVYGGS
jgi:hypothetical protein